MKVKIYIKESLLDELSNFLKFPFEHQIDFSISRIFPDQIGVTISYSDYELLKDHRTEECNKQIGLLMIKDENDILEEYLTKITQYFDPILVLDGTDNDDAREICAKFPEVKYYEKDCDVVIGKTLNSSRGILLEKARKIAPTKKWVATLHADEFPEGNPLELFRYVDDNFPKADSIVVRNILFFPHVSQRSTWKFENGDKIEPLMQWCTVPGWPEYRFFRLKDEISYLENTHSYCVPDSVVDKYAFIEDGFFFKHFSFRSKDQMKHRVKTRLESGWQPNYEIHLEQDDIFFESMDYPAITKDKSIVNPESRYNRIETIKMF